MKTLLAAKSKLALPEQKSDTIIITYFRSNSKPRGDDSTLCLVFYSNAQYSSRGGRPYRICRPLLGCGQDIKINVLIKLGALPN